MRAIVNVQVRNDLGMTNTATYQNAWWFYDGLGRVIQQQAPSVESGKTILANTNYNTTGQVWRVSNPYTTTASGGTYLTADWSQPYTEHQYDALGREIKTITPDPTISQTMAYSQWTTTLTDANNHQHQTLADAFGRTVTVKEFNAGATYTTTYQYNTLNQLSSVTDNATNQTTIAYDKLGRKTGMSDPDLGGWQYRYDNAGNLVKQLDAAQQLTCLYYDSLNRLVGKKYLNNVNNIDTFNCSGSYAVSYIYDQGTNGIGRRTSMSVTGVTTTTWGYDLQGRATSQTDTIDGMPYTTNWTYDAMSRIRTMTYPGGEVITTTYNTQGLPATLIGASNYITASMYSPAGQLTSLTFGNQVVTTNVYDPKSLRLTQLQTTGTTTLQNLQYQYDKVGNIKTITDSVRSEISNFAYDDLDRLTNVTGAYTQGWGYNSIGNITSRTGVDAATFSYNDAAHKHAVTQVGSAYYCYDANGNLYKSGAANSSCSSGGNALSYDTENRLTQVISGTVTTQYFYNADGARVKKIVGGVTTYYVGNYYEVTNSAVTKYYYFGAQRVAMQTSAADSLTNSENGLFRKTNLRFS